MKKFLQYNASHFRETPSDVGVNHLHRQTPDTNRNESLGPVVLDLSGRPNITPVAKVTDEKEANEQEAALDLSKSGQQESQEEALDLSKPSPRVPERPSSQSFPPAPSAHSGSQSHGSIHTPPVSRHSKSPAGQQYSLLQAALNSNQPNAGLHPVFDRMCQSTASMLEQQRALIFSSAGMPVTDYGRTIKPFSSLSSRPLGITMPHMSHSLGSVIQGTHKPIAITAPQPHNSAVNTKSQSVGDTTVSVTDASHSVSSTSNQGYSVSQSNYTSGFNSQISRQLNSVKMSNSDSLKYLPESLKDPNMVERYLIQPPKGLNNFVGHVNVLPSETLAGFTCNQCSKTFKTKAALKLHTTVHKTAEERQYVCTVCSRRFLHRHHLVVHQRKHSGEKPFKCTACSKTFMAIFLLHKHLRKHARETGAVSQISTEQLKQLHEKKLLQHPSSQPARSLTKGQPALDKTSVIVLDDDDEEDVNATVEIKVNNDDDGKLDRKRYERHKNQSILDMIEQDPGMLLEKLKADLIMTKSETASTNEVKPVIEEKEVADSKFEEEKTEVNSTDITAEETNVEANGTESENCEKEGFEEETDFYIKTEDMSSNYNYIIKDSSEELSDNTSEKEIVKNEVKDDFEDEDQKMKCLNPYPEYASDDEVELDFTTGELKVVGKIDKVKERLEEVCNGFQEESKYETVAAEAQNDFEGMNEQCYDKQKDSDDMITNSGSKSSDLDMKEKKTNKLKTETKENNELALESENMEYSKELEKWEKVKADFENSAQRDTLNDFEKSDKKKSEHKSGNIFEKIIEMKDCLRKTEDVRADKNTFEDSKNIDRDVEAILGVIKQKLCEDEDHLSRVSKKPKFSELDASMHVNGIAQHKNNVNELLGLTAPKHPRQRKGKKKAKKVKCEICSRNFHSDHYLVLHMAVHKRNPMLQSLKKAKDYQMKAMGFLNKANVTCEICKKVFKFQKSLNSHMRVHSEKMIQTKLYRKAFRDFMAEAAPQSSRTSSGEREKSQTQTSETESQMRRLSACEQRRKKENTVSAASVNRFSCDSETLKDDPYDEPPIKVIIGDDNIKRYLCHACDNTYTTRQKLRMHALIHKDNCFLCDVCGKSFFRHITLDKHISTHKLPRPHICEVCKKSFIHRSSLMRHKIVHEKPSVPSFKQQVADINFEMKMLDTYTMLRQERIQKHQLQKGVDKSKMGPMSVKYDPLDLTVRIKNEDLGLPPVLSPVSAGIPNVSHASTWNLSPPLITHETSSDISEKTPEKTDIAKSSETENKNLESVKQSNIIESRKRRTESTCSESDTVAVEGHQVVQKRSRKTRVYETSCRVCKEVFPSVVLLKSHMVVHNTVETHLYECHICRHRFTQSCSLLRHLKTSCQENRMKCVPCGRTFHRRNTFEQHMRLHQGGPTNLDGSFYDKRLDEAEVVEERESDIENNNLSKLEGAVANQDININPLRLELINFMDNETSNHVTVIKQDGADSDSDARTYLYSEGEVHSRYNSDFSDTDWSPPQSPRKHSVPQDLSVTSGNMTLNLLSAVCSDIINAEKEQELKRKELEEKQKELETIEILANLKRGAMQKSVNSNTTVYHVAQPSFANSEKANVASSSKSTSGSASGHSQLKSNFHEQIVNAEHCNDGYTIKSIHNSKSVKTKLGSDNRSSHCSPEPIPSTSYNTQHSQKLPSVIEGNLSSTSEPKIPTVVLEVAAEAERKRRQRVERSWQEKPFTTSTVGSPNSVINGPHSVSTIPPSSTLSPHSVQSTFHSVSSALQSASVVPHPSEASSHLSPFISQSPSRSPLLTASSHQSASNSSSASVVQKPSGRDSDSSNNSHKTGSDHHHSREVTLHQEMSQMKMHYPAIQERLSLLMKAQVSSSPTPGSSKSLSDPNPKSTISSMVLQPDVSSSPVKNTPNSYSDMPEDLSFKKISQENTSAHPTHSSRSFHSRAPSTDSPRTSQFERKKMSETGNSIPTDMPLPLAKGKMPESFKSLPSEIVKPMTTESRSNIPRSDSSKSLPVDMSSAVNNEQKRSESVPVQQQPLVPMLQCDLCSRVLYNKTDLHLHMMEHGRSAGALYKMLHSNKMLPEQKKQPTETPLNYSKAGPSSSFGLTPEKSKVTPPHSLDLSSKKSEKQLKAFNLSSSNTPENSPEAFSKMLWSSPHKGAEKLSPVSSSDLSDSLPSPLTPSGSTQPGANLDALRQELRLKIYARRRSQGLDDLKVEFKPPEPTEMTESEKLKLMYRRECNRQAAQRSRMRKKDLVDSLLELSTAKKVS